MANPCCMELTFVGEEEEIKKLYDFIKSEDIARHDIGISTYLEKLDITEEEIGKRYTRGMVTDVEEMQVSDDDTRFIMYAESAWVPCADIWNVVIKKFGFRSVDFALMAEEAGNNLFVRYNPDDIVPEYNAIDYYIEYDISKLDREEFAPFYKAFPDKEGSEYESTDVLISKLKKAFVSDIDSLEYLMARAVCFNHENDSRSFIRIYEIEDVDDLEGY